MTWQIKVAVAAFALTLSTTVFTAGYNYKKIDDTAEKANKIEVRLEALENGGSIMAKLSANDFAWLKSQFEEQRKQTEEQRKEMSETRKLLEIHMNVQTKGCSGTASIGNNQRALK